MQLQGLAGGEASEPGQDVLNILWRPRMLAFGDGVAEIFTDPLEIKATLGKIGDPFPDFLGHHPVVMQLQGRLWWQELMIVRQNCGGNCQAQLEESVGNPAMDGAFSDLRVGLIGFFASTTSASNAMTQFL